jgi:hypothetical protein
LLVVKGDENLREGTQTYGRHIVFPHTAVEVLQPECAATMERDK